MEYLIFGVLLFMSGFFSGSETALFSIGKVAHARLQQSERKIERVISSLLEKPKDLLVGVLLGNELTNVALSIVGASITSQWLSDYSLTKQALLSAAMVIPILLILGEITPKTVASKKPELIAALVARPIMIFIKATRPIIGFLRALTDFAIDRNLSKPVGEQADTTIDESEFRTLIEVGEQEGVLEAQEHQLIKNVLDFGDLSVGDVMRPWDRVFSLEDKTPIEKAIELVSGEPHSRIPIWRRHPRNVVGLLMAKDLLAIRWGLRPKRALNHLRRDPLFTFARRPAAELLEEFRASRTHMAIVINRSGQAIGLCTMEDLLEELFGPITDAHPGLNDPDERGGR
ncbi:MAG: hemolysin family protein [Myxococcota bacterium]|nr:hemolysin family protein [Myxococcota bacterium]